MGKSQCAHCGHIVTGFEDIEFHAAEHRRDAAKARVASALAFLAEAIKGGRPWSDECQRECDAALAA